MKAFAASAIVLGVLFPACASVRHQQPIARTIIATFDAWDGMGPPQSDPNFARLGCAGLLTITNVDVTFEPGTSRACATPMHEATRGTLAYGDIREIRITKRPEVLIFRNGANPPALRVTDWIGGKDFEQAVALLQGAYEISKTNRSAAR
jgi:hypothetical protein